MLEIIVIDMFLLVSEVLRAGFRHSYFHLDLGIVGTVVTKGIFIFCYGKFFLFRRQVTLSQSYLEYVLYHLYV